MQQIVWEDFTPSEQDFRERMSWLIARKVDIYHKFSRPWSFQDKIIAEDKSSAIALFCTTTDLYLTDYAGYANVKFHCGVPFVGIEVIDSNGAVLAFGYRCLIGFDDDQCKMGVYSNGNTALVRNICGSFLNNHAKPEWSRETEQEREKPKGFFASLFKKTFPLTFPEKPEPINFSVISLMEAIRLEVSPDMISDAFSNSHRQLLAPSTKFVVSVGQ